ncbi:MAG: adenosylcobinamide-GDP ribazoletransferase [Candidatus Bathyarchaeia archaeon]
MGVLHGLKNCVAFLTIIPVGMDDDAIQQAAYYMPIFPLIGALVGLLTGMFVWLLEFALQALIVGFLGVGILLLLNGVQHFDGLLDFGDGLMCHGPRKQKLRAMQDPRTGAGGLALGVVVLAATAVSIASLARPNVIQGILVSEVVGKFSMVVEARAGKAAQQGLGSVFVKSMNGRHRNMRLTGAFLSVLLVAVLSLRGIGLLAVVAGTAASMVLLSISRKAFGGITGDTMGAANELSRLVSLLVIVGATQWM